MRQGITVDGHADAIHRICHWLDAWRHEAPAGTWWPERVSLAELRTGRSVHDGPARPSWCYGTPGLARAQQLAGVLVDLAPGAFHGGQRRRVSQGAFSSMG